MSTVGIMTTGSAVKAPVPNVAARQEPDLGVGAGAADVVGLDRALGAGPDRLVVEEAAGLQGRIAQILDRHVLGDRHGADDAVVMAVLGNAGDACLDEIARRGAPDGVAIELHGTGIGLLEARDQAGDRRLAVTGDTGDADHLALVHGKGNAVQRLTVDGPGEGDTVEGKHRLVQNQHLDVAV